jgi:acetyl-CoA carboxylase carboxyltransferase component
MRTPFRAGIIEPTAPRYPAEDLLSIVNPDIRKPFDMSEVLLRIVDDSRLSVFKPKYGPNIITTWAHIMGEKLMKELWNEKKKGPDKRKSDS